MEPNGLGGGMFSSLGPGMLGLETPLHQQANPAATQNPHALHHPQMVSYAHQVTDHHQQQSSIKHGGYPYSPKAKSQLTLSDEDEPVVAADDSIGDPKKKISPWQRMKWTDAMVRLLIIAVFYIGDDGGSDGVDPTGKKKVTGGLLQKKGKWKSVSRAMIEKRYFVSPQQCEDKFNDLNKRYKRVNDILGKGTACKVVENQNLLETMDLSPKRKDEVRKLLNSKHLFFREMCVYHSSCGHGTGVVPANNVHASPEATGELSHIQPQQQLPQTAQRQRCFHSQDNVQVAPILGRSETGGLKMWKGGSGEDHEDDDDDDDDNEDDSEDDYEEDEDDILEGVSRSRSGHGHEDEDENDDRPSCKRARTTAFSNQSQAQLTQQISSDVMNVFQDGSKSAAEKKQWMKSKLMQLEERQVNYQAEACELEKQRLKWVKFCSKKEREMERAKLENQRRRLENERMVLLIRQKEFELFNLHHQQQQHLPQQPNSSNKRSDPSSITG